MKISHLILTIIISFGYCSCKTQTVNEDTSQAELKYIDITNATIAYKIYGQGEPLVMCIGYATNMDDISQDFWSSCVAIMSKKAMEGFQVTLRAV